MSRYLEEAAAQLRKATAEYEKQCADSDYPTLARSNLAEKRERIAQSFATLAAIDNGLLPAEITQDVIAALVARTTV